MLFHWFAMSQADIPTLSVIFIFTDNQTSIYGELPHGAGEGGGCGNHKTIYLYMFYLLDNPRTLKFPGKHFQQKATVGLDVNINIIKKTTKEKDINDESRQQSKSAITNVVAMSELESSGAIGCSGWVNMFCSLGDTRSWQNHLYSC